MSVNNVNSMYQTQGVQNGSAYTYQASDNSEGGVDIGKLLLGAGAAIAIGVTTCAAAKKGKTVSGDNGFFTNVVNGVKSWFGKNTDDVAKSATKGLSSEETNVLKQITAGFKEEEISKEALTNLNDKKNIIINNVKNTKITNNAQKCDAVSSLLKNTTTTEKNVQAHVDNLNRLFSNSLKKDIFEVDGDKIKIKGDLSAQDLAIVRGKLGDKLQVGNSITLNDIQSKLTELQGQYSAKLNDYEDFVSKIQNANNSSELQKALKDSKGNVRNFLNRNTALADLSNVSITTTDDYLRQLAKLDKYKTNGTITTEQYENARGILAFKNKEAYLENYVNNLKLTDKDGKVIDLNNAKFKDLSAESLNKLNDSTGWGYVSSDRNIKFDICSTGINIQACKIWEQESTYFKIGYCQKNISSTNLKRNVYNTSFSSDSMSFTENGNYLEINGYDNVFSKLETPKKII